MANRRQLLVTAAAAVLAVSARSWAQVRGRTPVVGYLSPVVPENSTDFRLEAFRAGMREFGYAEGKNYRLEIRWGEAKLDRMPALAAELVRLKVDVLVAASSPAVLAARDATRTVPIVMPVSSDPVGDGWVASLARPGGNLTGLSLMQPELGAKRLQMLHEVLPRKSRDIAVLWNPAYKGMRARYSETERAAPSVGVRVRSLEVRDPREMEAAFDAVAKERPDGLLLLADPLTFSMRARIVEFARENKLPAIYETRDFVDAGGLLCYGPNTSAMFRRAAYYVDRILKGAKPGELPIEQPAKIDLVVNLRTARELGVTIPASILANADQVIE
ncbi:MAG TPA: ABC transporter substrate-binding protein [Burkholderiales bacterium]